MEKTVKSGWPRLVELAATKKAWIMSSLFLSALASLASFVPYVAIYFIIREVLAAYPHYARLDVAAVMAYGWLALAGIAGNIILYFLALACSHMAAFGTLYELKVGFATHLAKVPLGFHMLAGSGKLRKVMDENIEKVEGFIAHQLPDIVAALVAPLVMAAILLTLDWRLGLAALLAVALSYFVLERAYGSAGKREMMREYQSKLEDMNNATVEYIRGISVVKAFRQTVYSFRRLHRTIRAYTDMVIPYTLSWENYMSAFIVIVNNVYLFVLPVGICIGMYTDEHAAFAGKFIFYLVFTPAVASVMMKVLYVMSNGMQIMDGVAVMDGYLARAPLPQPAQPKEAASWDICFNEVVFTYDEASEVTALNGVSFLARQNEVTAIVGPSGGGKSTIAHLIPRFFDVKSGGISLGGVDIREMATGYLMEKVSFVFQDVFLFKQSVRENIRMGSPAATDEEVVAAARAAQCHEFIDKLPAGYDTVIGAKGVHLSGGEKQRLAIARAIVKDAPVVVLDEATSFADPENEHLIQKAFAILMKNKTVVMIAHRLGSVRGADKIIVVENGRVAEEGTHDALLGRRGRYREMWEIYMQAANWRLAGGGKEGARYV